MCSLSGNSLLPSLRVIGNFPTGCISVPLAAFGMTLEGRRLSTCSFRRCSIASPAAESGKTETDVESLGEVMRIGMLGAGSVAATWLILEMSGSLPVESLLVDVVGTDLLGSDGGDLLRHTFAKSPNLPQLLHGSLNAGHLALPPDTP